MITRLPFRKIFEGTAAHHDMFKLFDRHSLAPKNNECLSGRIYKGEWYEIGKAEYDYMFGFLPPLFMRGGMFALREYLAGRTTSPFGRRAVALVPRLL